MRSRSEVRVALAAGAVLLATLHAGAAPVQSGLPPAAGGHFGEAEIARALEAVRADPNLATERTITTLQWKASTGKKTGTPAWMAWIAGLFGWLAQSARVLVWCAAAVLAGMLVVFIVRLLRGQAETLRPRTFVAPTHVRDLDIRPETLPPDIGAAARALWDRGDHRAALALLYRGLLSRLAHVHRVPIRDATTEGDCLALAARHLAPARQEYASRVVRVWERAVYGREQVDAAAVYLLCDDFAAALGSGSRAEPAAPAGAA